MKIAFFYPERGYLGTGNRSIWGGRFYYSLGVLAGVIKKQGHSVSIKGGVKTFTMMELSASVKREKPDLIGISALSHQSGSVRNMVGKLRSLAPGVPLVFGGIHCTIDPEDALLDSGADFVVCGEGEKPLTELLSTIESGKSPAGIPGVWRKQGTSITPALPAELVSDLDDLPFADLETAHFMESDDYRIFHRFPILAARGCPHSCDFCCNSAWQSLYGPGHYRFRSPEHVCDELQSVAVIYKDLEYIQFQNDVFFPNLQWLERFVKLYRQVNLPLSVLLSLDMINKDSAQLLAELPLREVFVGIEHGGLDRTGKSGGEDFAKSVCERTRILRDLGIRLATFNMLGIPGGTAGDIYDSLLLNTHAAPAMVQVSYLYPYRKTAVYDRFSGLRAPLSYPTYFEGTVFRRKHVERHLRFYFVNYVRLLELMISIAEKKDRLARILFRGLFWPLPLSLKRILLRIVSAKVQIERKVFRIRF
ncbi:MAG: radical SAM protein [Candidatus Wallbacteria bacterium]|nr:radical SAM protein [Candidatus Wallbacteria bacterium]